MDLDNNSASVSESTSTAPETTSSAPEVTSTPGTSTEASGGEINAQPAYQPNFKYKAAGKEYELEEEYRPYVKSADDEKRIKRLMEQAKAFEHVHGERETYKTKATAAEQELGQFQQGLQAINEHRSKKEMYKAMQGLGLSNDEILIAAKQLLDFDALPQEQQNMYHQSQEAQRQAQYLSQVNQSYASQMQALQTTVLRNELSQTLARPEIQDIQTKFDAVNGEGAFQQEVINAGKSHHAMYQQDLSATQAIESVARKFRPFLTQAQAQAAQIPGLQASGYQAPRDVPVIPSVKGAAQSAAEKGISSIDDMKRARKELFGS